MPDIFVRSGKRYRKATPSEVSEAAAQYGLTPLRGVVAMTNPRATREYLRSALSAREHEVFACLWLDNRHRVLEFQEIFRGTVDGASVHPREVVKEALARNAAAVILAHNHPSGVAEPSQADELITDRLRDALALVDIRVLDHIVVGGNQMVSFTERGLL
jgi:DNA repair protein RadC